MHMHNYDISIPRGLNLFALIPLIFFSELVLPSPIGLARDEHRAVHNVEDRRAISDLSSLA